MRWDVFLVGDAGGIAESGAMGAAVRHSGPNDLNLMPRTKELRAAACRRPRDAVDVVDSGEFQESERRAGWTWPPISLQGWGGSGRWMQRCSVFGWIRCAFAGGWSV